MIRYDGKKCWWKLFSIAYPSFGKHVDTTIFYITHILKLSRIECGITCHHKTFICLFICFIKKQYIFFFFRQVRLLYTVNI